MLPACGNSANHDGPTCGDELARRRQRRRRARSTAPSTCRPASQGHVDLRLPRRRRLLRRSTPAARTSAATSARGARPISSRASPVPATARPTTPTGAEPTSPAPAPLTHYRVCAEPSGALVVDLSTTVDPTTRFKPYAATLAGESPSLSPSSRSRSRRLLERRLSGQAGRRAAQAVARAPPHRRRARTIRSVSRRHQAAAGAGARGAPLRRRACSACAAATPSPASSIRTARPSRGTSPPRRRTSSRRTSIASPSSAPFPISASSTRRTPSARRSGCAREDLDVYVRPGRRLLDARHHLRSDLLVDARRLRRAHRRGDAARDDPRHRLPARPQRVEREPGHRRRHRRRGAVLRRRAATPRRWRALIERGAPARARRGGVRALSGAAWSVAGVALRRDGAVTRRTSCRAREQIFAAARSQFLTLFPPPPGKKPGVFAAAPLNNAVVLSFSVYHRTTPQHRALLAERRRQPARASSRCASTPSRTSPIRSSIWPTCGRPIAPRPSSSGFPSSPFSSS